MFGMVAILFCLQSGNCIDDNIWTKDLNFWHIYFQICVSSIKDVNWWNIGYFDMMEMYQYIWLYYFIK